MSDNVLITTDHAEGLADDRRFMGLVSVVSGLLVALCGLLPRSFTVVLALLFVLAFSYGWGTFMQSFVKSSPLTVQIMVAITGVAGVLAVWISNDLAAAAMVLGLVVIAAFISEMMRSLPRKNTLMSVSGTVLGSIFAVLTASWVSLNEQALWHETIFPAGIAVTVIAVAGMFFTKRSFHRVSLFGAGALTGGVTAAILVATGVLDRLKIVVLSTVPYMSQHPHVALVVAGVALGIVFAGLIVFSSFFADYSHHVFGASERICFGVMPVMLAGLPLYTFIRVVGT
ncbi:MAG: hypothetical protein Q4P66_03380 [Actinomycetaceae bacterium]|nr:hypothetical protein [Actinomycetaceae bacterium]